MNERGIALPAALIALMVLASLMVAFAVLAGTEPIIAANHSSAARARALAESGVERAIWALSVGSGTASGVDAPPAGQQAGAPYNGTYVAVANGTGGFRVTITGSSPTKVTVNSVGWTPDDTNPNNAHRRITADLGRVPLMTPPCGMCLGGESPPSATSNLQVGGKATVDASQTAGYCPGVMPQAAIMTTGTVSTNGSPNLVAPPGGEQTLSGQPQSTMQSFTLTDEEMAVLRDLAKANGSYFQGSQHWTSPPPDGIVFVDTPSGNPLNNVTSSTEDKNTVVQIDGNWGSAVWRGWLIVAGSIEIQGNINMTGLVYAQNDVEIHGNGTGGITGAVIAQNRVDTISSVVDSEDIGNGRLDYNCLAVRDGGGRIPQNWFVQGGTYREVKGQ